MATPTPKPRGLKVLEGNKNLKKTPKNPKPSTRLPRAPNSLDRNAKKLWRVYVKQLQESGILTEIDGHQLADLCRAESHLEDLREERDKYELTYENEKGEIKPNPMISVVQQQEYRVRLMRADFGLNPVARNKVQAITVDKDDKMRKLIG